MVWAWELGARNSWALIPALTVTPSVALGKSLNLSASVSPAVKGRLTILSSIHQWIWESWLNILRDLEVHSNLEIKLTLFINVLIGNIPVVVRYWHKTAILYLASPAFQLWVFLNVHFTSPQLSWFYLVKLVLEVFWHPASSSSMSFQDTIPTKTSFQPIPD